MNIHIRLVLGVRGSGVLSDISCHMGRGLLHKNVIIAFDSSCCKVNKAQEDRSLLGKSRASRKVSLFYCQLTVQNPITYVMYI